jgi:hypothetical protein
MMDKVKNINTLYRTIARNVQTSTIGSEFDNFTISASRQVVARTNNVLYRCIVEVGETSL